MFNLNLYYLYIKGNSLYTEKKQDAREKSNLFLKKSTFIVSSVFFKQGYVQPHHLHNDSLKLYDTKTIIYTGSQ